MNSPPPTKLDEPTVGLLRVRASAIRKVYDKLLDNDRLNDWLILVNVNFPDADPVGARPRDEYADMLDKNGHHGPADAVRHGEVPDGYALVVILTNRGSAAKRRQTIQLDVTVWAPSAPVSYLSEVAGRYGRSKS